MLLTSSKLNEQIATEFVSSLAKQVKEERAAGKPDLRSRFEELRGIFCRSDLDRRSGRNQAAHAVDWRVEAVARSGLPRGAGA